MAKKPMATLQKGEGRVRTKCIKMCKSKKTGAYYFKEEMVLNTDIDKFFQEEEK